MMKKIFQIAILVFLACQLHGQAPFSIEPNPSFGAGDATDNFFNADAEIFNLTDSTIIFAWERTLQNVPVGWESATCLNITCLPPDVESGEFTIDAGYSIDLISTFYPNDVGGEGEVHLKVWIKNDTTFSITQVYFGNASPTHVQSTSLSPPLSIFPNPSANSFSLKGDQAFESIEIYSIEGQKLHTSDRRPHYTIDFLPTNLYFVHVFSKQRELLAVLKLNKI